MMLKNVSARPHHVNGVMVAPGQSIEVSDDQGRALIAATRGKNAAPQSGELVEGDPPMPDVKVRTISDLDDAAAIKLVQEANIASLDKLTENEKRPEVLSAVLKRKKAGA